MSGLPANWPIAHMMPIGDIHVGERHRKDLGDIGGLAASIVELGLLHPIVVRPDGELIAGARRLEALKLLGRSEIPVTSINLDDIVRGEFAENVHRKNFTPSEISAIADAIEPLERAKAKERHGERTDQHPAKFSRSSGGRALDKVATFAGVSRPTLAKVRAVCQAADLNPEQCAPIKERMDATGNVDRAYKQIQIITRRREHAERTKHGCTVDDLVALADSGQRFGVIYADPPWPFATWAESGKSRSAEKYYNTEQLDKIAKLPIGALAADDCALFLWCTGPHIAIGSHVKVIEAWRFRPSTIAFDWLKLNPSGGWHVGMGFWSRSNSEQCFILFLIVLAARRVDLLSTEPAIGEVISVKRTGVFVNNVPEHAVKMRVKGRKLITECRVLDYLGPDVGDVYNIKISRLNPAVAKIVNPAVAEIAYS